MVLPHRDISRKMPSFSPLRTDIGPCARAFMRPAAQADVRYGEQFIGYCRLPIRQAFFGR